MFIIQIKFNANFIVTKNKKKTNKQKNKTNTVYYVAKNLKRFISTIRMIAASSKTTLKQPLTIIFSVSVLVSISISISVSISVSSTLHSNSNQLASIEGCDDNKTEIKIHIYMAYN